MLSCECEWWTCECEQWTCECEQLSPNESFQGYTIVVNGILFDEWNKIFGDMEEYSATCHGWTIFLDEKRWQIKWLNFYKGWMPNHRWHTISFIKDIIISCWFYFEKYNTWNVNVILQVIFHISLIWISTTSRPFRILN
jgi:hypothetical protein